MAPNDGPERRQAVRDIYRLLYDYSWHLDRNDPDALAALFTDDCEVGFAPGLAAKGRGELREMLNGIGRHFSATSHHNSNIVIDFLDGEHAEVRSVVLAAHQYVRGGPDGMLYGQYVDLVVRERGWRFRQRTLLTAMTQNFHLPAGFPIGRLEPDACASC